ncbi:MAG: methylmalonyl-CoA epimerase [Candidatus Hodarchaeota archaeon]
MITKIDHIGIAVKDLNKAMKKYVDIFGLRATSEEVHADLNIRICFIPVGEVLIEFLEPLSEEGRIGQFIKENGEGIHHIAYRVADLEEILKIIKNKKIKLRDDRPRSGGMGSRIAFIDPSETNGVLTELVERL